MVSVVRAPARVGIVAPALESASFVGGAIDGVVAQDHRTSTTSSWAAAPATVPASCSPATGIGCAGSGPPDAADAELAVALPEDARGRRVGLTLECEETWTPRENGDHRRPGCSIDAIEVR